MGKLNVVVLYDRWEEPEEAEAPADKAPLTRTLDKKEVEDEVAETLGKLGHEATLHVLDGSTKSLHALARIDCDLVFNLAESFGGNDTADYCIAAYLELLDKRITGAGSRGLLYGQDKAVAKKILEFHGIHTPVFARSYRGRLDFSHDLAFPVIVKPAREDGSIGIEFNAVVSSIRELMERIDWLHSNFDSPVLIEEYVDGREMYVGVIGNDNPVALPVIELDLSKLPEGRPRIAGAEVKWGKGTRAYRDTKSAVAEDLPEEHNRVEIDESAVDAAGVPGVRMIYRTAQNTKDLLAFNVERATESLREAGAKETIVAPMIRETGWHILGTTTMGEHRDSSVVDQWGRAHDVPNLIVVDGSTWPTSSGMNPTPTIAAFSLRAIEHAIEERATQAVAS